MVKDVFLTNVAETAGPHVQKRKKNLDINYIHSTKVNSNGSYTYCAMQNYKTLRRKYRL